MDRSTSEGLLSAGRRAQGDALSTWSSLVVVFMTALANTLATTTQIHSASIRFPSAVQTIVRSPEELFSPIFKAASHTTSLPAFNCQISPPWPCVAAFRERPVTTYKVALAVSSHWIQIHRNLWVQQRMLRSSIIFRYTTGMHFA